MKSRVIIILLATLSSLFAQELISDPHFKRGLEILDPESGQSQGSIGWSGESTVWQCAQWHSHSSLIDMAPIQPADGLYEWLNADKVVRMGPGAGEYDLYLGVNSDSEYGGVYRQNGQPWPHLLVQQPLSPPGTVGPGCPPLSELAALNFQVQARLDSAHIIKKSGYDPNIHAAQFLIYFTVQNLNRSSAGFGKIIWLGVPVYDDRYPMPAKYVAHDDGTSTLIYTIAYRDAAAKSVQDGEWVAFQVDLLPYAIKALQAAWDRGYLPESHDLTDYKIGGMNMGWEVPGLSYTAMMTRGLSLEATAKTKVDRKKAPTPKSFHLYPNYPNPFNPSTTIVYELSKRTVVNLSVFDLAARRVAQLVNGEQTAGRHEMTWSADGLPGGVYILSIHAGMESLSRRILLLK